MQKLTVLAAFAASAALAATAASAATGAFRAEATLATAVSAPKEAVVNGVNWRCEGDKCVGQAEHYSTLDSPIRECRKVASALGEVKAYTTRGRELSAGTVKVCNANAVAKAGAKGGDTLAAQK